MVTTTVGSRASKAAHQYSKSICYWIGASGLPGDAGGVVDRVAAYKNDMDKRFQAWLAELVAPRGGRRGHNVHG